MSDYQIELYTDSYMANWDDFVLTKSSNGTFLQTKNFLNYHPSDRFKDYSLIVYDIKGHVAAVVPGCIINDGNSKVFSSHRGSTFGGPVISEKHYSIQKTTEIIETIEDFLRLNDINIIEYKTTPSVFSRKRSDLIEYALYYEKYTPSISLCLHVDYSDYKEDIYSNLSQGKRTDVNNCKKVGMKYRNLDTLQDITDMYDILCENLQKYNTKPVHSIDELMDFKDNRLKDNVEFYGVFLEKEMVAASMMFYFGNEIAHTQYLCAKSEYNKLSPMSFLYYSTLEEMKTKGFKKLSWGCTTEDNGTVINMGLAKSKESYGGTYYNNYTYRKILV